MWQPRTELPVRWEILPTRAETYSLHHPGVAVCFECARNLSQDTDHVILCMRMPVRSNVFRMTSQVRIATLILYMSHLFLCTSLGFRQPQRRAILRQAHCWNLRDSSASIGEVSLYVRACFYPRHMCMHGVLTPKSCLRILFLPPLSPSSGAAQPAGLNTLGTPRGVKSHVSSMTGRVCDQSWRWEQRRRRWNRTW
jgi:hypothetical protein